MAEDSVAYVLKGYPRRSELFIASEIWRLEQLGINLRLYVLKPPDEVGHHAVVDRIASQPSYLPALAPLSGTPLLRWLRTNRAQYLPALRRTLARHPVALGRAAGAAAAQSIRARKGWQPRTIYVKELLHAVELADRLRADPDVRHLHGHFAHGTTTVTWLAAMLTGLPFSFTAHAKDIYLESLNPAGLLARKMRAARFVVTCTGANRDHLQRIEPSAAVHLIYHGLNVDFAELLHAAPVAADSSEHETLRVVSVGRLVPKKGFDVLIDAVAELRDREVPIELLIAGEEGESAEALRNQVIALDLNAVVQMVGPVTQKGLLELYRGADVFALACRIVDDGDRDGIPNVAVEAMAAGLPVVSTAVSGLPELVRDGENGLLVAPDDPHQLADALLRLAKDPHARARLADAARATVRAEFDGGALAKRLAPLFARNVGGAA